MSCELWRDWLDAYVDDACTPEEIAGIEDHLRTCNSCAAEALARLRMKRATRNAATAHYVPSPEFRLRIQQSIHEPHKSAWNLPYFKIPKLTAPWLRGLAATSAALVFVVAVWVTVSVRQAARDRALAELLDLHVATTASANPVDVVSTDRHAVKPWFQGKLPFAFNLPELQSSPFKLVGGKVVYFKHSPGAQLLFELRKHELSEFILQEVPGVTPAGAGVSASRQKGFSLETWSYAGLRYVVIGDASPSDVHDLSELLRTAETQ